MQFTKGAPDEVLRRCTWIQENGHRVELTEEKRKQILAANKAMADKALRVLCAACRCGPVCRQTSRRRIWSRI